MSQPFEPYRRRERNRARFLALLVTLTSVLVWTWGSFTLRVLSVPAVLLVALALAWHYQPDAIEHRAWWAWTKSSRGRP